MKPIETSRLILRMWKEEDLSAFAALNQDLEVMEFFPAPLTYEETKTFVERIKKHFTLYGFGLWAVELKETGAFMGFVGLNVPNFDAPFTPCVEIGWRLAKDYWGKGYALEAAQAVLKEAFTTYNLEEVVSFTTLENRRSRRVMEKLGMRHDPQEDFLHPKLDPNHPLAKHVLYRIKKEEFHKQKVYEQYNEIVDWYDHHRNKSLMERAYLDLIVQMIPAGGSILDLGCGTGEPIAQFFIERGYSLTGVDGGSQMIERCRQRFPDQTWLVTDMRNFHLDNLFDAILAWHSFFHLPHEDQRKMFKVFASHLKPGGILAFTSGPEYGEVWSDNGGQNLYHASLSTAEYQTLLAQYHFEILMHKIEDPECGNATIWIAQKRK